VEEQDMGIQSKMMVLTLALAALSGCATMGNWTPQQTAAFVGAMQVTANAVDPYEYAGPRQPVEPPAEAVVTAPVAVASNGRPFTPTFPQSSPQPVAQSTAAPIGSTITPSVTCETYANTTTCH
jgi:hypothetical protein